MKKPMKKLLSILFVAVLFCTMVTWPDLSAKAASDDKEARGAAIKRQIEGAPAGSTLNIDVKEAAVFESQVVIKNNNITVNFTGKHIAGAYRSPSDLAGNRVFYIDANNVTLNFGNVRFTNMCCSEDDGGAIYINGGNCKITGGVFEGCYSKGNEGGSIYIDGDNATITGSRFIGSGYPYAGYRGKITNQGGAIYVNGKNAKIENCNFTDCAATKEGGAIYMNKDYGTVSNCYFKGCVSNTNDGGAIFTSADDIKIENCSFENCSAKGSSSNGGAICAGYETDYLQVRRCKFTSCIAGGRGNWVYGRTTSDKNTIVHCSKPYSEPNYVECIFDGEYDCTAKDLTKIDGQPASCTKDGTKPYWECFCGNRYSSEAPNSNTFIRDLAAWKSGAGKDPAKGHNFEYKKSGNTLTLECTRNKSHMASLTLLEKDSTYPGNTNKTWEDVVAGDKDRAYWPQLAGAGIDFDVWYYTLDNNKTSPSNGGATAEGHSPKNVGNYKLVVQVTEGGKIVPEGRIEQPFTIHPKKITSEMVTIDPVDAEYIESGTGVTVTVADGSNLTPSDYTVSGETSATTPGPHTVTVTGRGNYTDTANVMWSIRNAQPLVMSGTLSAIPITYGDSLRNAFINSGSCKFTSGDIPVAGTFAWEDPNIVPEKAGSETHTVVFTPTNPIYGIRKISVSVRVDAKDISKNVTIDTPDTYNGNELNDYITVTYEGEPLVKGTDYDVTCKPTEVKEPGDYTATVKFKGNYTGTVTQDFKVVRYLTEDDLTFIVNEAYEGDNTHEAITIKLDDKTLERGTDYDISGVLDESKAPTEYKYTANIKFKGKYAGEIKDKVFVADYPIPDPGPAPAPTPTPDPGPYTPSPSAPSSAPSAPSGTIGGNTGGKVTVSTYEGTAALSDVPVSVINDAANAEAGTDLVLDISGTSRGLKKISRVTIPKKTIENVVTVLNSPTNNKDRLVIAFDTATIAADAKSLASIVSQAKGEKVQFVVEAINQIGLNDSQKSIVDGFNNSTGKNVEQVFQAYVESGGSRVPEFEGGIITVGMADYKVPAGKNEKNFHIYYLSPEGKREHCVTWIENKTLYFGTGHFSDYAIVYDETMLNGPGNEVYRLYNSENGDHLFTISKAERDAAQKGGWKYDGVSFIAIEEGNKVYRLLDPGTGEHIFTESTNERDALSNAGWIVEGVAFLSYGETEVLRLIFPGGMHMFTANEKEKAALVADGWIYEGVAFKAN